MDDAGVRQYPCPELGSLDRRGVTGLESAELEKLTKERKVELALPHNTIPKQALRS